jgi:hypothetical protein
MKTPLISTEFTVDNVITIKASLPPSPCNAPVSADFAGKRVNDGYRCGRVNLNLNASADVNGRVHRYFG